MADLAPHFTYDELACKDGCGYGRPHPDLLRVLERLRAHIGRPLVVVSGIRCPVRNREVGGAIRSRHQSGEAADLPAGLFRRAHALGAGATGIGINSEGWVVHVDVRRARKPIEWRYP